MRKVCQTGNRLGFGFFDIIHARGARTFPQTRAQSGQLIARAHGQHFHAAVGIIAHPSGNAENVRLAFHKPAKTNALHASANQKAAGSEWLFLSWPYLHRELSS